MRSGVLRQAVFTGILYFGATACTALGGDCTNYLQSFNPEKGFKPAQTDLTEVFLQLAGSLEYYGSPEPYLRHVLSEYARVEAEYQKPFGKAANGLCPAYMTAKYIDECAADWNILAPRLGLKSLTQRFGAMTRLAIKGSSGTGTPVTGIFAQHQREIFKSLTGGPDTSFEALKQQLFSQLQLDRDQPDIQGFDAGHREAVTYAGSIQATTQALFTKLDENLKADDATKLKNSLDGVFVNLGRMAESEVKIGILDSMIQEHESAASYTAQKEEALDSEERRIFSALLNKKRFTKADFGVLNRFYIKAYDRLSEQGKTELSRRVWAGTRPPE